MTQGSLGCRPAWPRVARPMIDAVMQLLETMPRAQPVADATFGGSLVELMKLGESLSQLRSATKQPDVIAAAVACAARSHAQGSYVPPFVRHRCPRCGHPSPDKERNDERDDEHLDDAA